MFSNTAVVYAEWVNDGVDSGPQETSYDPTTNANVHVRVENVGDRDIWRFVVANQGSPFNYSPTMDFNSGYTITNSEHYINCDTLYASFQNLDYSDSPGNWTSSYEDYQCYFDDSDDWYFHLNSNSSSDVTQTSSSC